MQKRVQSVCQLFATIFSLLFIATSYAGNPLWTFTPDPYYPPSLSITSVGSATIQYTITNQSRTTHTLAMKPINGITQITSGGSCPSSFTLGYHQSCTLSLLVNGSLLTNNILGGPIVCEEGSALLCYQPSAANALHINLIPIAKFLITPLSNGNGVITPNTPQTIVAGNQLTFTATPDSGYQVDQWLVDGGIVQKGGSTFTLSHIDANHTVEATFTRLGTIYAGTLSGFIYFSMDNGLTWTTTTSPSPGNRVNSVFATQNSLYAGSADGKVYYSTNNGVLWNATTTVPDSSSVNTVVITSINNVTTIYCGTENGHVYYTTDGIAWTATSNPGSGPVNSLFITPSNILYVGSEDGNVYYSINNGNSWNQIVGPLSGSSVPVHHVFATANQLYVNTRKVTSNSTLPPGTIDFEYAYSSNSLTNPNPSWTLLSQITYTLFVNSDASMIYAGTQGGYVFSLTTGEELGFITYSPISSLFFLG